MPSTHRARGVRLLAALGLVGALVAPAAAPAAAQDELVLRTATTQEIDSLNPYMSALVSSYEAFLLSYNLLVDFGPDLEPVPGFAESWERNADGKAWTFKIRPDMKWSDGEPATSEDACFSWQLAIDAIAAESNIGLGYLDPGLADAGVTKVECPDATTMIATTEDASQRILQTYLPIIPKHIWGEETWETIDDAKFEPPLVGTGPYLATEWRSGQDVTFVRNPEYWGDKGAADKIVMQFFSQADTMVQALKAGEIDYARGINAEQLNALKTEADIVTVVGTANGWTQLGFNTYGTGTDKTIEGGGPSTPALLDAAFRDALGYAIDKQEMVDRILGGYGEVGTTQVPPVLTTWHVEPDTARTFDIEAAKQKLTAAGYALDSGGNRLDKDGKPISLRLVMPDSDETYPTAAQFITDWFGQLGVKVTSQTFESGALVDLMLPPEAGGEGNKADYDLFIWGWAGNPDPNALLQIFTCDAIGTSSDSNWCNSDYDAMYEEQNAATTVEARKPILAEMQQLFYNEAPYHILYYDANLDAYRTDRFSDWWLQPSANGTPLFTYGTLGYTLLSDATAVPSPEPSPSAGASAAASASPAPSGDGGEGAADEGDNTLLIVGLAALAVVVVVGGFLVYSRRRTGPTEEE